MSVEYVINKDRTLPPASDYELLKREGIKYIEKLGNRLWTDYNAHDPGITILEVLAYVITELGHRSNFSINDLVTDKNGLITNGSFFPADTILTNAPLTEIDYRKLLIDIEGVSNAWFLATDKATDSDGFYVPNTAEKTIYVNVLEDKLSFSAVNRKNENIPTLKIRGLGKVLIEMDEDPTLGDLNSTITEYEFALTTPEKWIQVTIFPEFSSWNDPKTLLIANMFANGAIPSVTPLTGNKVKFVLTGGGTMLEFTVEAQDKNELTDIENYLGTGEHYKEILELYILKKNKVAEISREVLYKLHSNRNVTEDYLEINVINSWLISVCAKIDLNPQTNPVDVMVQVQMAIYEVLNPSVKFYTLSQLVDEGYTTEDIFLGPKLQYGFLKDTEVAKSQLPTAIHTSDIIAAVMKVAGVASIRDVLLTAYDEKGKPVQGQTNVQWCLHLPGNVRPTLNRKRSQIKLYQKGLPFFLSEDEEKNIDQQISIYKSFLGNYKIAGADTAYPFPTGTHYQFDEYYSIQNDFPATYGLGPNTLPQTVTPKRKAQVKQLKGYLYFFEQILADFFSQLYNAKNLLDIKTLKSSYFTDYLGGGSSSAEEFYSRDLLKNGLGKLYGYDGESGNGLYESESEFYERRNRSLDHLMARFGESFNDYVFMMYKMRTESSGRTTYTIDNAELIEDKQNFIESYPEISSNRSLALNYTLEAGVPVGGAYNNYWDTSNIGGYAKRAARLLGINIWPLQPYESDNGKTYWVLNVDEEATYFYFIDPDVDLSQKKRWVNQNIQGNIYSIKAEGTPSRFYIYMADGANPIVKIDKAFDSDGEAQAFLDKFLASLDLPYEYFYCLEHILLRAFPGMEVFGSDPDENLLPVCLDDDCNCEANADPYSFKATIVLPGWMGRFANPAFREYAERVFREEAPAHVLLKICWIGDEDMNGKDNNQDGVMEVMGFRQAYKEWYDTYYSFRDLESKGIDNDPIIEIHLEKHIQLIRAMKNLNTTYPAGHLYDCENGETNTPIILGNSKLGNL